MRSERKKLRATHNTIFKKPEPFVLVYIFDVLVNAFRYEKDCSGEKILDGYPRMAALAEWCETISCCLEYKENDFISACHENMRNQSNEVIESLPVAEVLLVFIGEKKRPLLSGGNHHIASQRLERYNISNKTQVKTKHSMPKASNKLTFKINEIVPNLKEKGIEIITGEKKWRRKHSH